MSNVKYNRKYSTNLSLITINICESKAYNISITLRARYFKIYNTSDSNCARFRQTRSLEMNAGLQTVFPSKRIQAIQETF